MKSPEANVSSLFNMITPNTRRYLFDNLQTPKAPSAPTTPLIAAPEGLINLDRYFVNKTTMVPFHGGDGEHSDQLSGQIPAPNLAANLLSLAGMMVKFPQTFGVNKICLYPTEQELEGKLWINILVQK